jgi:hypothetical protein
VTRPGLWDPSRLTDAQRVAAEAIGAVLSYDRELHPFAAVWSHCMALCEVESSFRAGVEAADGLSRGLFQVLDLAAEEVGVCHCPQTVPLCSAMAGLRHLSLVCGQVDAEPVLLDGLVRAPLFGRSEASAMVYIQAYNVGVRGYRNGRRNVPYYQRWRAADARWRKVQQEDTANR